MPVLYKYRPWSSQAQEMLVNQEIYFASSQQLNDPYDCQISIRNALQDAIERAVQKGDISSKENLEQFQKINHVYENMENDVKNAGVFSLAKYATNVVMWAFYGDDHCGFCAGFELSEKFTTHQNDQQIVGIQDVYYAKSNPFEDFFDELASSSEVPSWDKFWQSLLSMGMVAKAEPWGYEEEVRVLRKKQGVVSFSPSELVEIVFGMNMPLEHRETIRELLSGDEWGHVQFREIFRAEGFKLGIQAANAT